MLLHGFSSKPNAGFQLVLWEASYEGLTTEAFGLLQAWKAIAGSSH